MADFLMNQTGVLQGIVNGVNVNVTGNEFLSLLLVCVIAILILCFMFRIPLEISMILVLPVALVLVSARAGDFRIVTSVILLFLGVVFAKHFFFLR